MPQITIRPAAAERWSDIAAVFGRRGENASWCWCRTFLGPGPLIDGSGAPDNRAALRDEVLTDDIPPGLIDYLDGDPVGGSRIGPRSHFPGITENRTLASALTPDPDAWWVTCFSIRKSARNLGVARILLQADLEHARAHGATVVQGYPVDVDNLTAKRVGASALYTGTLRLFSSCGFDEVARPSPTRPLMQHRLQGTVESG